MDDRPEVRASRSERGRERRSKRLRLALYPLSVVAAVVVLGATVAYAFWGPQLLARLSTHAEAHPPLAASVSEQLSATTGASSGRVEVPDLDGMPLSQATTMLQAAGLSASVSVVATMPPSLGQDVAEQFPAAGTVVAPGTAVALRVPSVAKGAPVVPAKTHKGQLVVVIDPGHQSRPDNGMEPVGPGSTLLQPRMSAGSTGAATKIPEYEIDLQIATNLKDRLEKAGVRVVMTRTTNDIDLSNARRAQIANAAKADLLVRVHADNLADAGTSGVSTVYPATNQWTKSFSARSEAAAASVQGTLVEETGAADNGETARGDQAGFNWSKVPVILVDAGNPGNAVEDRLLASPRYQDQVAAGIAKGILQYLGRG